MGFVQVEIGPVSRNSAEAWFDYADSVIDVLRRLGADRAPPEMLDAFEVLVGTWRTELPPEPGFGGEPESFRWVAERSDDEVGYLINALFETGLAVEQAHQRGQLQLRPPEADDFHFAVVRQVLAALEAEGGSQSHLVEILREHWGVAGD